MRGGRLALLALLAVLAVPPGAGAAVGGAIDSRFASCGQATGLVPRDVAGRQFSYGAGAALAAQPDGKIVAAGPAARGMGATRFNPDGSLDRGFGGDGVAFVAAAVGRSAQSFVTSVAVQPDGKVVAAGWLFAETDGDAPAPLVRRFLVARFTAAGEPDTTFSGDGLFEYVPPGAATASAHAVAPAAGGALVVAGQVDDRFALVRLRDDGTLDPAFGEAGVARVTSAARPTGRADAVAILPDGRILAAGQTTAAGLGGSQAFTVARFTAGGAPDPAFAGGGSFTETFDESSAATALVPLPDGRFYAVGSTVDFWGGNENTTERAAIVRYGADGARDSSFAGDGTVLDALGGGLYARVFPSGAALDADGRLAISTQRGPLARYTPDGARDATFGTGGVLRLFGATSGESLIALPGGALVLGGSNDRQGRRPSGFEWGPAIMRLAGSGAALAAVQNQPGACFLRLRNPTIAHLLRRGRVARNGKALVGFYLTQPGFGYVGAVVEGPRGEILATIGETSFSSRSAGTNAVEIRVRKAAAKLLRTKRSARIRVTLSLQEEGVQPVSVLRTLRR